MADNEEDGSLDNGQRRAESYEYSEERKSADLPVAFFRSPVTAGARRRDLYLRLRAGRACAFSGARLGRTARAVGSRRGETA